MNILQLFDFFSPLHGGGTVDLLYKISRELARRGHEVSIYTSDFELDRDFIDSIPEVNISTFHCYSSLGRFFITPGVYTRAKNEIKRFDVVHMHCFRSFQNSVVAHFAHKYRVPYLVDAHGSLPRSVANKNLAKVPVKWLYDSVLGKTLLDNASRLVAENAYGSGEYRKFGVEKDRITIIHPPLDTGEYTGLPAPGSFRNRYKIEQQNIILFLGRIHWIKGLDFLVESYSRLVRARPDTLLVLVGPDDGYLPDLKKLVLEHGLDDKVLFTGFLGGDDKLAALVDADVLIQPSVYEQGARPSLEAILCGTPVIVSSDTGAGEDIRQFDGGYLVEYGNIEDLVNTVNSVLDDKESAAAKTEKAKAYIIDNFSLDAVIGEYERLYKEVAGA